MALFCPKCGNQVGGNFCRKCGTPVQAEVASTITLGVSNAVQSHPQGAANQAIKTTSTLLQGKVITTAITIAIVVAGVILYNMFGISKPEAVVKKFVEAVNSKDISKAISCFEPKYEKTFKATSNLLGKFIGVSLVDMADLFPMIYDFAKVENNGKIADLKIEITEILSKEINGDKAQIKVNLKGTQTDENGNVTDVDGYDIFYLQKFAEGWRITQIGDKSTWGMNGTRGGSGSSEGGL